MKTKNSPTTLTGALKHAGLSTRKLVILFGSRASGCSEPDSDWDFLVVDSTIPPGERVTDRQSGFDTIRVPSVLDEKFLGSELAAHVAWYGLPISTGLPPRDRIDYASAAAQVEKRVLRRTESWFRCEKFSRSLMDPRALRLFLDSIRARHLRRGVGVPPSARVLSEFSGMTTSDRTALFPRGTSADAVENGLSRLLAAAERAAGS